MIAALALAFLSGAIALSYEILWYRAFSFASGGRADSFGLLLGAYLAGLALGSLGVRRICRDDRGREALMGGLFLLTLLANLLGFFAVPLLASLLARDLSWGYGLVLVGFAAAFLGAVFPLVTHAWIAPDEKVGRNVSYIYLANILGSTSGSLATGFVLTDRLTLAGMHVLLFFLGLGMAAILPAIGAFRRRGAAAAAVAALAVLNGLFGTAPFDAVYEKLQEKGGYSPARRFAHVVETKSGVITVNDQAQIFGGGIYDGAFNTSLSADKNLIIRCYALAEIHPAPKDVLMIGLSSGSWGSVIAANPAVERLTIVEINDGYLQLLPKYPEVAGLLKDPKVTVVIDDGRRWMVRNADRKFDMIVANATFHWRSNASNLLSKEFLELVRSRLKPGGLYAYNTTGSTRVVATGRSVFPHALLLGAVLVVSDSPLALDLHRLGERLTGYPRGDGVAIGDPALKERVIREFRKIVRTPDALGGPPITDDNMGTEWEKTPTVFQ